MKLVVIAGLVFVVLSLSACTTPDDIISQYGQPDLIYEQTGDMSRYYLGDELVEHAWQWDRKTLYYFERNHAFTFTGSFLDNTRQPNSDEQRIYQGMIEHR